MFTNYYLELLLYTLSILSLKSFLYFLFYINLFLSSNKLLITKYDYVIVGSGTAGSLIAHRMATETNFSYIVLEAGGQSSFIFDIPIVGPLLQGSPYDWQFTTETQSNACLAMKNQKCRLPQGKVTGGSAKLNNMIHVRGNLTQYVEWFHNKYDLDTFKNQFDFIEKHILYEEEMQYESLLANNILEAVDELKYRIVNVNKDFSTGFMKSRVNQRNGKRWSTSQKFDNKITILNNVLVTKILINSEKAYGVQFKMFNELREIHANKGLIISAGTMNTPKILLLSGIGPMNTLRKMNIPVLKDLPVGHNLQDHVTTGLDLIIFNKTLKIGVSDMLNPLNLFQYVSYGKGPLTSPGCEVVGFISTESISCPNPNLQFMVLPVGIASDLGSHLSRSIGIKDEVWASYFSKTYGKYTASILPILLHPKSRGVVTIKDKNPESPPSINPNYLQYRSDVRVIVEGLKVVQKIVDTESMRKLGAKINPDKFPGCEQFTIFTDDYWECYVRHLTLTSFHPIGTCKMGLPEFKSSVVDTSFNVIDVGNLYVVDGSVLPSLPTGNVNAAIAMIANLFFDKNIMDGDFNLVVSLDTDACYLKDYVLCNYFSYCVNFRQNKSIGH